MTGSYPNTWKGVEKAAKKAGARYPELVAAQWALESGWGKHTSGKHNYFGLKGQGSYCETTEVINGETITIRDNFLNFVNLGQCVCYLVDRWYKDFESWKGVNNAVSRDAAAYELKAQGYATDPNYVTKLIELMDNHATNGVEKVAQDSCTRIQAVQDTWLKKETVQSSELGEDERVAVPAGKSYSVLKWNELPTQAHAEVSLDHGAGTWYIYEPHWKHEGPHRDKPDVDWEDFDCLLTPNITVGEVLQYDKRRIPAKGASVRARLLRTAAEFQKVRDAWGGPLGVTSFYRPEPINQQVGGVPGSRHVVGEAFDVYPVDRSLESFYQWIRVRWTGGLGDGRHRGFVHMDTRLGGGFVPGAGARPAAEWTY
jgi:hypothetical protein